MNNSNTLGLNEFGVDSKILRDIDMNISFSDDSNCIIMPAIIENYTNEKITGMFIKVIENLLIHDCNNFDLIQRFGLGARESSLLPKEYLQEAGEIFNDF
jgi:hypothetical protein